MNSTGMPIALKRMVDNEKTDFFVKSRRNYPKKKAVSVLVFSLLWNALVSVFVVAFIWPLFKGEEVHFKSNDVPTSGSLENWEPVLVPTLIIGLFVVVGLITFFSGMFMLFQRGGYFVGTETRFIKYRRGKFIVKDWEQFSGNIEIKSNRTLGDLELELRTGKMKSRDKGSDKFVPDIMYLSGIRNAFDVEKKCRIRIKENDPTPRVAIETT
ncbi:hypothetical protein HX109_09040 [Galbibacter sp. BG1]|uniref:hypothetical protein n=1 Tax=Galbibacter sp. BG1 TaxID=1170699 RepID=UPI0015BE1168|nr:hypothetical protein [Galbibacter sp. BG1]QLE01694.1 hypothetical protein HX109_09040 [Galbibacter sp. BG1]